jgi:hypothetical protein
MGGKGSGGQRTGAGRKSKAAIEHWLAGSKSRAGKPAARVTVDEFDAPNDLTTEERNVWLRLAPHAFKARTLTPGTEYQFVMLCRNILLERRIAGCRAGRRGEPSRDHPADRCGAGAVRAGADGQANDRRRTEGRGPVRCFRAGRNALMGERKAPRPVDRTQVKPPPPPAPPPKRYRMNPIDAYARDVDSGRIPAGKYHRLACQRHLRDRQREGTPAFPYRFDMAKAQRFASFVGLLKHYKGEWAGTPIQLQPWQLFILGSLFGWVHAETGLRRFRSTYFEVPRKNGKSTIAATAALYLAFFDGEPGAEGYTVATKRDQAKIVFADAKKMVESSGLKSRIGVRVANLHRTDTSCKLEPLGADHDSTDGLNPHLVVIDEWHAYKDRGLIDVMETATGARRQPVIFGITTAGNDPVSPCGDQHDYACKVLDGVLVDESLLTFVAHADLEDDWQAETTWAKANPNWNVSVKPDDMRALARKAANMPPRPPRSSRSA